MLKKLVTQNRKKTQQNTIDALKDVEPTIEKINKILTESMDTIQNKKQKSTIKKSTKDTKIESLNKKRKA